MAQELIDQPGKFIGEPLYAPLVWDVVLNGFHDEVGNGEEPIARVSVDSLNEYENLQIPDGAVFFEAWEDSNGFVYTDVFCEHKNPNAWSMPCPEHPGCTMQGPDA